MGQYRQWLQCREIDHQLHEQLHQLEAQLVQLQVLVGKNMPQEEMLANNKIMHALAVYAQTERPASDLGREKERELPERQSSRNFSPALQARGGFAAAETPEIREMLQQQQSRKMPEPPPGTPHTELALLPEDINTFIEEHTQTGQQQPPAWWLQTLQQQTPHPALPSMPGEQSRSVEQPGMRPNRLVQRWVARWGKQLHQMQEATKDHE